jgi:hypothetical protein
MTNHDPNDDLPTRAELGAQRRATRQCYWCLETHSGVCPEAPYFVEDDAFPAWAELRVYEYDLGMATDCEQCCSPLWEGSYVFKDKEGRNSYYCSEQCVRKANES